MLRQRAVAEVRPQLGSQIPGVKLSSHMAAFSFILWSISINWSCVCFFPIVCFQLGSEVLVNKDGIFHSMHST